MYIISILEYIPHILFGPLVINTDFRKVKIYLLVLWVSQN